MGGAVSTGEDNEELVDNLVEAKYVKTPCIETALRAVDRGNYYLEGYRDTAYKDLAWKNGNLHLSAPCIYSEVLECLKLSPGQSFLNLGSGTGYLSTVAGLLLGSYGINHGVEQHADVVDYANERLIEFMLNSSALDMMDFCRPSFVVGNCLQLEPSCSVQAYDRVYCGAAVPPEYLAYIKNLVKVGGIVVMPSGDQLLQIHRVKDDAWDTKNVLPVSFATLVEPTPEERASDVSIVLPDRVPLKLQEICRSTVRTCLRSNVQTENPDFKMRSVLQTKKRRSSGDRRMNSGGSSDGDGDAGVSRRRRRFIRRILIPVFRTDSDEDDPEASPQPPGMFAEDDEGDATDGQRNDGAEEADGEGEEVRRRARRPIIAIGTAGVSRRSGGRLHMEDLRWNRFYVGGNAHRNDSTDEEASRDGHDRGDDGDDRPNNGNRTGIDHMPIDEDIRDSLDCEQRLLLSGVIDNDEHGRLMEPEQEQHEQMDESNSNKPDTEEDLELPRLSDSKENQPTRLSSGSELPQLVDGSDLPPLTDGSESEEEEEEKEPIARSKGRSASPKTQMTSRSVAGSTGVPTVSSTGESSKRCHSESEHPEAEARRKRAAAISSSFETPPICQPWRGLASDGDSDASDEESETHREQQRQLRHENVSMQKKFSEAMSSKISTLPVPDSVKAYLNYYRK